MAFNSFAIKLLLRLLLIVANCLVLGYVFLLEKYPVTQLNLFVLLIIQIYALFVYLSRWQKDLRIFADSVKHGDFNLHYNLTNRNNPHHELYAVLNHINEVVRGLKAQVEQQNQYLQTVIENTQVGFIAYDDNGTVVLYNKEVCNINSLRSDDKLKNLNSLQPEMINHLKILVPGQPRLVTIKSKQVQKLSLRMSRIIIDGNGLNIVSMLNIRHELEENELQSWQDLINVLTHEIMNSITPIHSLNGSMSKYLDKIKDNEDIVEKAKSSLAVISRRSQLLMDFVERYRQISAVPLPEKKLIKVKPLLAEVLLLMNEQLTGVNVLVEGDDANIFADAGMIEQVLINLIKNALHAMERVADKQLLIRIMVESSTTKIMITDNGQGIKPDIADKIFIPFYTTRVQGSGIGLTISRQVMQRHGGRIEFITEPGQLTSFSLVFPKDN